MGYTKLMDKNGIIAFLDFEKAFDTIQWDVIYDALKLFNIGPTFIKWVHTVYNETEACVTNNGFSSPFFKLQRGVRQGCPLNHSKNYSIKKQQLPKIPKQMANYRRFFNLE